MKYASGDFCIIQYVCVLVCVCVCVRACAFVYSCLRLYLVVYTKFGYVNQLNAEESFLRS